MNLSTRRPILEIFIPFYGDPGLLQQTVRSVLAQSDAAWTLTVVDDGYPDPSVGDFFSEISDSRVTYLRNDVNLGANGNYRRCVELARGDLMVILGADDLLLPDYVRIVCDAAAKFPQAAVIQPGVQVIDSHGDQVGTLLDTAKKKLVRPSVREHRLLAGESLATSLLRGNWLYFPSLAFRVHPIQQTGFQPGFDVCQDLALVVDLIVEGQSLLLLETVCFSYRRHSASDSSWRALEGTRFVEERRYFRQAELQMRTVGWFRAAGAARRHLLSRANALTVIPQALLARRWSGARTLAGHVVGIRSKGATR